MVFADFFPGKGIIKLIGGRSPVGIIEAMQIVNSAS